MRISNLIRRIENKVIALDAAAYKHVVAPLFNKAMDANAKLERTKCEVAARVLAKAAPDVAVTALCDALERTSMDRCLDCAYNPGLCDTHNAAAKE